MYSITVWSRGDGCNDAFAKSELILLLVVPLLNFSEGNFESAVENNKKE